MGGGYVTVVLLLVPHLSGFVLSFVVPLAVRGASCLSCEDAGEDAPVMGWRGINPIVLV